jgi:phosphatidate cytidylyltransferase
VAQAPPVKQDKSAPTPGVGRSNLALRVVSSAVLAPLAIAATYFGGPAFVLFWAIAALGVLWEWQTLVCAHDRNPVLTIGAVALVGATALLAFGWPGTAVALVALGALGVATLASRVRRYWCLTGLLYAAAVLIAPAILRGDPALGFAAILFVFTIVWLTDIVAYFVGRAVGGPKLMPAVSPNKTWSGALGGTAAGIVGGVVLARQFGVGPSSAVVAFALSVISQAGDLAESALKRAFQVKDSSNLLPGHGGLMDRLDGFIAAAAAAAALGLLHGGLEAPARGLMVW